MVANFQNIYYKKKNNKKKKEKVLKGSMKEALEAFESL